MGAPLHQGRGPWFREGSGGSRSRKPARTGLHAALSGFWNLKVKQGGVHFIHTVEQNKRPGAGGWGFLPDRRASLWEHTSIKRPDTLNVHGPITMQRGQYREEGLHWRLWLPRSKCLRKSDTNNLTFRLSPEGQVRFPERKGNNFARRSDRTKVKRPKGGWQVW